MNHVPEITARQNRAKAWFEQLRDEARSQSDLDVFIDYDPDSRFNAFDLVGIKHYLEDELRIPVDVTTRDGLHPMLKADIERSAIRIF